MKTYKKIFIAVGVVVLSLSSCDKNFDEINTNPNKPSTVTVAGIFTEVQRGLAYNYYNVWSGLRMAGLPSQHWSQRTYTNEDRYNYTARTSTILGFFNRTYLVSELANKIIDINDETPIAAGVYGDKAAQVGSVRIIKAWLMTQNVETFGDVPYTQANNLTEFPLPKYDTQESIFLGLIAELKEVNALLLTAGSGWTSGDVIFNGDVDKWRRFGNSLRLRLAMRMSNINPTLSAKEAALAITDGVMESNAHNASFYFTGSSSPVLAPLSDGFQTRHDFVPSWQFTNLLAGENDDATNFVNPFNGISDPRLFQMVLSPAVIAAGGSIRLEGMPYGLKSSDNDAVWAAIDNNDDKAKNVAVNYGLTSGKQDADLAKPVWNKFWSTLMDYTNVALFIAEHKGNDRGYFEQGVEASLDMWGVPAADATAYTTNVMAKFDAANDEGKLEMIITQKYIHNFAHADLEAWTEYRRTEYPTSLVLPGEQSGITYSIEVEKGVFEDKTYTFTPSSSGYTRIIDRMLYSTGEATANKKSLDAAIASMGGDAQNIPLWWSKAYSK